jgi:hypothetical protein
MGAGALRQFVAVCGTVRGLATQSRFLKKNSQISKLRVYCRIWHKT